ncbi:MAG: hypothetical protein M1396_05100 [Chloroflexi bacterium]|nr:hypothetical protein [Chloroflexota bacterium]
MMNGYQQPSTVITIEFLLNSGERFVVSDFISGPQPDAAIQAVGEQLASDMNEGKLRHFAYWEGDTYQYEVVKMDQVAAFSITFNEGDAEGGEE